MIKDRRTNPTDRIRRNKEKDIKREVIEKAKKAFCRSTCKGYQDIGRCLCDGNCDKYNKFVDLLEE